MRPTLPCFLAIVLSFGLSHGALAAHGATTPGKLELGPCKTSGVPDDARCGTYEVFENRASKSGRKIPLRVVVIPANAPQKELDAVAYFAGGPGGSAVLEGAWLAEVFQGKGPRTSGMAYTWSSPTARTPTTA